MSQNQELSRLEVDWDELFPTEDVEIGKTKVAIPPLGLKKLSSIIRQLKTIGAELSEAGITWENYNHQESIIKMASVILENIPATLSEASGIHVEDIERLPIQSVVAILTTVISTNSKSKEILAKNFESLAKTMGGMMSSSPLVKSSKN